ncbi:(3R)-hydroxyacyl-ACP dehydratase subunit HadC [Mycobacteroides abscessus subsp. abscessus]|uniref:MaoC family dehydratase n=1 Tax=Dermabacter vaginalis TaxID=1630135 RepID=A0ABX6A3P8_9MICO|nr:MaoC family dehydratase N-terminal domain-containing protein [Dermabacter vaginalis]QEU11489.1 MaoC family dehydratase [Dermabacter vaginalis]SHX50659.1 (3R)-hydroxyacyl-ACP dehydratase subunit HadC [Mycobacteroides abscessus subsp. abscessus]
MASPHPDFAGRVYESGPSVRVSETKIREFAAATGNTHAFTTSEEAAREAGYSAIVAPPTFLVTLAQAEEARYINDPEAGIDFSRVVHSEESFELERAIVAGDELIPTLTVEAVKQVGPHAMVTTRVDFTDRSKAHVASVRSSLVVRGEEG